ARGDRVEAEELLDEFADQRLHLSEQIAGGGIEGVVEIEDPRLHMRQRMRRGRAGGRRSGRGFSGKEGHGSQRVKPLWPAGNTEQAWRGLLNASLSPVLPCCSRPPP